MYNFKDLKNYNIIISYDDDNHYKRIFVNGIYVGFSDDPADLITTAAKLIDITKPTLSETIYITDIDDEQIADIINDYFSESVKINLESQLAVINHNISELIKIIKSKI